MPVNDIGLRVSVGHLEPLLYALLIMGIHLSFLFFV